MTIQQLPQNSGELAPAALDSRGRDVRVEDLQDAGPLHQPPSGMMGHLVGGITWKSLRLSSWLQKQYMISK